LSIKERKLKFETALAGVHFGPIKLHGWTASKVLPICKSAASDLETEHVDPQRDEHSKQIRPGHVTASQTPDWFGQLVLPVNHGRVKCDTWRRREGGDI